MASGSRSRRRSTAPDGRAAPPVSDSSMGEAEAFRALLETTLQRAVEAIVICDAQGNARFANASALELAQGDASHATVDGAAQFWGVAYDTDGRRMDLDDWPIKKALRGETTTRQELHMVRPDGREYDVLCSAAPVWGPRGEIVAAVVNFTDITARKRAEAEVLFLNQQLEDRVRARTAELEKAKAQVESEIQQRLKSEAEITALIENTMDAIWSVDRAHRIIAINSLARQRFRERFGTELDIGGTFAGRVPENVDETLRSFFDRALAGERLVLEQRYPIDGETHHFLVSCHPIVDGGEVTGVTVFSKDVTVQKRAEAQLRERVAELAHVLRVRTAGEIAAGLAHEINQPLGAISNYAQGCVRRMRAGDITMEELVPIVDEIGREALRAAEVLRRLRLLVRKEEPQRTAVDLNEIAREAVRLLRFEAEKRHVELHVETLNALPLVRADRVQIEQVVINLLVNALDALENANGALRRVVIRTYATTEAVGVSVRDNGIGLDEETCAKVFEAFFTTKPAGLGMGLAISRSIIEAHHGRLWATPSPEGGASFDFTLPLRAPS